MGRNLNKISCLVVTGKCIFIFPAPPLHFKWLTDHPDPFIGSFTPLKPTTTISTSFRLQLSRYKIKMLGENDQYPFRSAKQSLPIIHCYDINRAMKQLTWNLTFDTVTSPWFMAYNWISSNINYCVYIGISVVCSHHKSHRCWSTSKLYLVKL